MTNDDLWCSTKLMHWTTVSGYGHHMLAAEIDSSHAGRCLRICLPLCSYSITLDRLPQWHQIQSNSNIFILIGGFSVIVLLNNCFLNKLSSFLANELKSQNHIDSWRVSAHVVNYLIFNRYANASHGLKRSKLPHHQRYYIDL